FPMWPAGLTTGGPFPFSGHNAMNDEYLQRLQELWAEQGHPPASPALVQGWLQLQQAANELGRETPWRVCQLPTGSGKSTAAAVLCAVQDEEQHPGILYVARYIDDANKLVRTINRLACTEA